MEERSPAQVYALVIGLTLVVAGIVGFFYSASFSTGDGTERDAVLGILDVNGWHNVVHILSGVAGLALMGMIEENLRLPLVPVQEKTRNRMREILTEVGLLKEPSHAGGGSGSRPWRRAQTSSFIAKTGLSSTS